MLACIFPAALLLRNYKGILWLPKSWQSHNQGQTSFNCNELNFSEVLVKGTNLSLCFFSHFVISKELLQGVETAASGGRSIPNIT